MANDIKVKTYTKEFSNVDQKRRSVWDIINVDHSDRTESFQSNLFQSGPNKELKQDLLEIIASARKMLIVSSFLFADQEIKKELISVARQGVNVYFLLAAKGRLEREPDADSEFDKRVYKEHLETLNELSPFIYIRSADHFHAKVVLADPFDDSPRGMLLTANLTRDALERNEELAYLLYPEQIEGIASALRFVFWGESEHHVLDDSLSAIQPHKMLPPPDTNSGVYYNSNSKNTLKDRVLQLIKSAETEIIFSTFGIGEDHEIFKLILSKLNQGVNVKFFARFKRGKMNPVFHKLKSAGAEVYGFRWLHAKAFLIDQKYGFLLTANLERHGMDDGFEIGVDLRSNDVESLSRLFSEWEEKHQYIFHSDTTLGQLSRKYYKFDSASGQYKIETIKEFAILDRVIKTVAEETDLQENERDFSNLRAKAETTLALNVKMEVEKRFIPKKKEKTKKKEKAKKK